MTTFDSDTTAAIADARTRQLTANTFHSNAVDPDVAARSALRDLGRISPGASVADALFATTVFPAVAVDRNTLAPSGDPFGSYSDIVEHFDAHYADGVGLMLGTHAGASLVAVRGTATAFNEWLATVGVERRDVDNGEGQVRADSSYRPCPPYVRVHWAPPPVKARATPVAIGNAAIMAEGEKVHTDRAGVPEIGWVAWSTGVAWAASPQPGRQLRFTNKKLGHGMEVLAEGVLPMAAQRQDGWAITATGTPQVSEDFPGWLIDALGARWA